jgi:hypothetical protein
VLHGQNISLAALSASTCRDVYNASIAPIDGGEYRVQYRTAATIGGSFMCLVILAACFAHKAAAQDAFNCTDFTYQEDAQAVFDRDPSDPITSTTTTTA